MAVSTSTLERVQLLRSAGNDIYDVDEDAFNCVFKNTLNSLPIILVVCGNHCYEKSLLVKLFERLLTEYSNFNGNITQLDGVVLESIHKKFDYKEGTLADGLTVFRKVWLKPTQEGNTSTFLLEAKSPTCSSDVVAKRALLLGCILGSSLVYNITKHITKNDLNHLRMFIKLGKQLKKLRLKSVMQRLQFVIHDWEGDTTYDKRDTYLKNIFANDPDSRKDFDALKNAFKIIDCTLMPSIHSNKAKFLNLFVNLAWTTCLQINVKTYSLCQFHDYNQFLLTAEKFVSLIGSPESELKEMLFEECAKSSLELVLADAVETFRVIVAEALENPFYSGDFNALFVEAKSAANKKAEDFPREFERKQWYIERHKIYENAMDFHEQFVKKTFHNNIVTMEETPKYNVMNKENQVQSIPNSSNEQRHSKLEEKKKPQRIARKPGDCKQAFPEAKNVFVKELKEVDVWASEDEINKRVTIAHSRAIDNFEKKFSEKEQQSEHNRYYLALLEDGLIKIRDEILKQHEQQKSKWIKEILRICLASTEIYNTEMKKATKSWVSWSTFRDSEETANKTAIQYFTQSTLRFPKVALESYIIKLNNSIEEIKTTYEEKYKQFEKNLSTVFLNHITKCEEIYEKIMKDKKVELIDTEDEFNNLHEKVAQEVCLEFDDLCAEKTKISSYFVTNKTALMARLYSSKKEIWKNTQHDRENMKFLEYTVKKAVVFYKESMEAALFLPDLVFDENHKKITKASKKIVTLSEYWSKPKYRKFMEVKFNEMIANEKAFFSTLFEITTHWRKIEETNSIQIAYQNAMDKGMDCASSSQQFGNLHITSAGSALASLKWNKKVVKEEISLFKKQLNADKEKYNIMVELKQTLETKYSNYKEITTKLFSGNLTMLSFIPAHEIFYTKSSEIASGSFSTVKYAYHKIHGEMALKCHNVTCDKEKLQDFLRPLTRGIEMFHLVHHANVVQVIGYTCWEGGIGVALEYMAGGSLSQLILDSRVNIQVPMKLRFCTEIASAIAFLQGSTNLTIGMLNIHDVLLDRDLHCKVTGFKFKNFLDGNSVTPLSNRNLFADAQVLGRIIHAVLVRKVPENDTHFCIEKLAKLKNDIEEPNDLHTLRTLVNEMRSCLGMETTCLSVRDTLRGQFNLCSANMINNKSCILLEKLILRKQPTDLVSLSENQYC